MKAVMVSVASQERYFKDVPRGGFFNLPYWGQYLKVNGCIAVNIKDGTVMDMDEESRVFYYPDAEVRW